VKCYRKKDSIVEFFARALKHECPENFYDSMIQRRDLVKQIAAKLHKNMLLSKLNSCDETFNTIPLSVLTQIAIKVY
jgi:hypothetical protein